MSGAPELQAEIAVPWAMKTPASAEIQEEQLPDGRLRFSIRHDLIAGVTPAMLVWWFNNMDGDIVIAGRPWPRYRIWHPRDHIALFYLRPADDGRTAGPGAVFRIVEHFDRRSDYRIDIKAHVKRLDEGGFMHIDTISGLEVSRMEYKFTATPQGTLYENSLTVGTTLPLIGKTINRHILPSRFPVEQGRAWIKHNVEEVGNFQFFLPDLYAHR